ncbi:M16 family metallopeptidase [Pseudochrobactrum asaccharolyticum]|uniref:M16 family metallopeptidase n=1 Tax=Pseudochrobactrum asaccharolyticum TaxID=354351 RepID=UPI001F2F3338|nr:pitrilysin family protein [Pseudochrobactrum asaccharolyticum]MCF7643923.1 insulinase family protein [Pseudochrobactrum asaccharolyticum]
MLALLVSSAAVGASYAQAAKPAAPPVATSADKPANDNQQAALPDIKTQSGVSSFQLANGLDVVVIPDHRAPVVTQMVWYRVGAADEQEGVSGIAHFLEHLMFKGTKNVPAGEFSAKVAAIGGQENAFTSSDYTGYYQQIAPDALEMVMKYESDRMANLVLTDEVIIPERDVILEERRMRVDSSPAAMLREEVSAATFYNHPYRRPIIGWQQEMEKLSLNDAIGFYERYYTPNNAILVVAGDVTPERVRELALSTYGKLPKRFDIAPRIRPQEPEKHTSRTVILRDARVNQPSYNSTWVVPSYINAKAKGREGDAEALDLLGEILGGGIRSRLYQELVVEQGLAASAGAYYAGDALDDGTFMIYGSPRGDATLEDVQTAANVEVDRIIAEGVTETELNQARNRFLKAMIFARDSQTGMARIYGSSLATGQTVDDVLGWPDKIRAVKPEQIRDVAERYLKPSLEVTGYLLPSAEQKTTEAQPAVKPAAGGKAEAGAPEGKPKDAKSEVKK